MAKTNKTSRATNNEEHTKLYGICENKCLVPVYSQEQTNEKLETKLEKKSWNMTLTSANWTLVEGMYEQRVNLSGMLEIYEPEPPILVTSNDKPTKITQIDNMKVREIESYDGYVIYRCIDKPAVDLPVKLEVLV